MWLFSRQFFRHNKFFLIVSILLGLLLVTVGWHIEKDNSQRLNDHLMIEAKSLRNGFELSQKDLQQQMLLVAKLLAENTRIQTLFFQGSEALSKEGGGKGGHETAFWRAALLQYISSRWQLMQDEFGLRQLQFHLMPDVTSFVRVHQPDVFGDSLAEVRPILKDVLTDQQARSGFETGRIYSGVRGVVPVWFQLPNEPLHFVGTLEAGTSLDTQLMRLDQQYNAGFAVLLKQTHVDQHVWEEFQNLNGMALPEGCHCYIEASTREDVAGLLAQFDLTEMDLGINTALVQHNNEHIHIVRFPLYDYQGESDLSSAVGSVWVWQDKTDLVEAIHQARIRLWSALLITFLLSSLGVAWVLQLTRRRLTQKIDRAVALQLSTEQALKSVESRYQNAFAAINDGLWEVNLITGELQWDQRCFEMLGYTEMRPLRVEDWYDHIHPDDIEEVKVKIERHFKTHEPYQIEYRSRCADGSWLWVEGRGRVVRWVGNTPEIMMGSATDISARKKAELELRRLSITDSLTGLSNRRYFFKRLASLFISYKRKQRPVSVIMLDLDHFKAINDQYGHAAGDRVLKEFAKRVEAILRQPDLFARLGGEEFALLLDDTDVEGATELAERIKNALATSPFNYKKHQIQVSASMGISMFHPTDTQADDVMLRADRVMYQAKLSGRNAIVCHYSVEDQ